jgi:hypothetical protein
VHGSTLAVALPLDLAAELFGEAVDQPAAEPGIGPSRIEPLAVVGDRQAKLPGRPLYITDSMEAIFFTRMFWEGEK